MAANPKIVTCNFLTEQNNLLLQIYTFLSKSNMDKNYPQNEDGLLQILFDLTQYMKDNQIKFPFSQQFGIVFFNDCFLMNPQIFSAFIIWPEDIALNIILSKCFSLCSLTKSQHLNLVTNKFIYGCIFDWKVLKYPNCELSLKIIDNLVPAGGQSFHLITTETQNLIYQKEPQLKIVSSNLVDIPPDKDHEATAISTSFEESLLQFSKEAKSPKKCWLLYKENK